MTITLGGLTDTALGFVVILGTQVPILPATRDRTVEIPFKHGAFDFGSDMGPRTFELECAFTTATSPTDLQIKVRDLASHLTDTRGESRTLALVFDDEPEKTYNVRYTGNLPIERIAKFGRFTLPLTAFDPFATAGITAFDENNLYDTGLQYDSGLIYDNPESFSWIFPSHMSGMFNHSKLTTPLIITITGTVTNPSITNATTGETITITSALAAQTLVIDGKKKTVSIGGVNKLNLMTGVFVNLLQGSNGLTFSGTSPNATVTYQWLHKFV